MRVFITGGTGLIGRGLVKRLLERGDAPVVLSRQADQVRRRPEFRPVMVLQGDPAVAGVWDATVDGCDAVINLAGHNLFADRWTTEVKRRIRDSRVHSTEHVVAAIAKAKNPPKVLVQASAIGFYGARDEEELTEDSPPGSDFMAVVTREWEAAAATVEPLGVRLATVRTGVVMARGEGALGVMAPVFRWLPGGAAPVGGHGHPLRPAAGRQWMSWIHIDDIVGLYLLALDSPEARGPINGTAPNPVRNYEFSKTLATVLWRRWVFLPFGPPDLMMELVLGEVAQVITKGQKVLPARAKALGYTFQYPDLVPALQAIFARSRPAATPALAPQSHAVHH
jgi:uncharacterized protein (TIGR01777 family)